MTDSSDGQAKDRKLTEVSDDQVYNWLTRYLLHQDQLSWSRTQTLVAVEAGVLAAAFYLNGKSSAVPLLLGGFIVWLLWCLIRRDWQVRDQDLLKLDDVHRAYGIRVTISPPVPWWSGSKVALTLIWLITITNIVLAILFVACGSKDFLKW